MSIRILQTILLCLPVLTAAAAFGNEPVRDRYVEAQLVSSAAAVQPGQSFWVALRLAHDEGWHTYWKESTTGYPPKIDWELPEGWEAGAIRWPTPRVYTTGHIVDYVFEDEVLLPVEMVVPEEVRESQVTLRASVEWLMCEEICIPGDARLSLTIPVASAESAAHSEWAEAIERAVADLPVELPEWETTAHHDGDRMWLVLRNAGSNHEPEELYFFSDNRMVVPEERQRIERVDDTTWIISLERSPEAPSDPQRMTGVLRSENGWRPDGSLPGMRVDASLVADVPGALGAAGASPASQNLFSGGFLGFAGVMGLAFLGGLILNLMPCVFPVLGLKVMGFVKQAGEARGRIVLHGLTFTAGVLLSFWLLAVAIILLRSGGQSLGWGFQLQSPVFVFAITIVLFAFALNLSGLFEFGESAVGVGSRFLQRPGLNGSFFSGVLATVVATPCAAPFLAPALGAAFAIPPAESFIVFTMIALGLSAPYLIMSLFPGLMKYLPRPGEWMLTFKQFMAFPLYATVGFLLWVLAGQLVPERYGHFALLWLFLGLVLIALAAWMYGRYGTAKRTPRVRRIARVATLLLLGGGILAAYPAERTGDDPLAVEWRDWSKEREERLLDEGNILYVDFTARWCATCLTNKMNVFRSRRVLERFRELEVVALQADWTNRDDRITDELASYGRSAIPFNVVYAPGLDEPIILPELLTPGIVLDALERAEAAAQRDQQAVFAKGEDA